MVPLRRILHNLGHFHRSFQGVPLHRQMFRLKHELYRHIEHPQENLREFFYTVLPYYDRIGKNVPESEKVDRVLHQMQPQLQDLAAGSTFPDLKMLVAAADGLRERVRHRLQYHPPQPKTNQVVRDLVYAAPGVPDVMTAGQHAAAVCFSNDGAG